MKFAGELKFPDIDHPGVPVQLVIDGTQTELIVEGESLGRWSLYDVHARRLIASAFEIDLDGTEVTFVAADPIDFAYRGVEHMAQTWAAMKAKRIATRTIAVRKSRRDTKPSRIEDLRAAMESNLEEQGPRPIAGEHSMPTTPRAEPSVGAAEPEAVREPTFASDWDQRDQAGAIPLVGQGATASPPQPVEEPVDSEPEGAEPAVVAKSQEELSLEAEKRALAEERARLEEERRAAEQREANLIEAYRLEVERLEAEREELRRQAAEAAERSAAERDAAEQAAKEAADRAAAEEAATAEREAAARAEMEREASEREERERQAREREAAVQAELERRIAEREAREREASEREAAERAAREAAETEEQERRAREREAAEAEAAERERERAAAGANAQAEDAGEEEERVPSTRPAFDASAFRRDVVDLDDLEDRGDGMAPASPAPAPKPQPEPALAGAPKEKGGGLMGAVKAAFRGGPKDHEHQFVEAPGGIGITRYVCEECGYVSISV